MDIPYLFWMLTRTLASTQSSWRPHLRIRLNSAGLPVCILVVLHPPGITSHQDGEIARPGFWAEKREHSNQSNPLSIQQKCMITNSTISISVRLCVWYCRTHASYLSQSSRFPPNNASLRTLARLMQRIQFNSTSPVLHLLLLFDHA